MAARIRLPRRGLYAITDPDLTAALGLELAVARAIDGGAVMIQYRDKEGSQADRRARARALLRLCRERHVPLIVNDDLDLAMEVGADGVHLGRDDGELTRARRMIGPEGILGVSCYDDVGRALAAQEAGADYLAFGSFHPSGTKPGAARANLDLLRAAREHLRSPIVAIGGITPDNAIPLLEAGADLLAAIVGVFGAEDPSAAATRYARLWTPADGSS
jgi:thiamine-phosphate pyrophosphorylase